MYWNVFWSNEYSKLETSSWIRVLHKYMYICFYQRLFWLQTAQLFSIDLLMWHVKKIKIHSFMFYFFNITCKYVIFIRLFFPVSVKFGISWFFAELCYACCRLPINFLQKNMILLLNLPDAISCWFTDCVYVPVHADTLSTCKIAGFTSFLWILLKHVIGAHW